MKHKIIQRFKEYGVVAPEDIVTTYENIAEYVDSEGHETYSKDKMVYDYIEDYFNEKRCVESSYDFSIYGNSIRLQFNKDSNLAETLAGFGTQGLVEMFPFGLPLQSTTLKYAGHIKMFVKEFEDVDKKLWFKEMGKFFSKYIGGALSQLFYLTFYILIRDYQAAATIASNRYTGEELAPFDICVNVIWREMGNTNYLDTNNESDLDTFWNEFTRRLEYEK